MSPPAPSGRILVRGVNWLGDAVMTTPALLRLREALPGVHITLLTPAKLKDLWHNHPALNAIETFAEGESARSIGRRLRAGKFDTGLVLPNSPRSALELWLARIPRRIGYAGAWRNWFLTETIAARPGAVKMHKRSPAEVKQLVATSAAAERLPIAAHHIYQYLHLVAAIGAKVEPLPPQLEITQTAVKQFADKFGLEMEPAESSPCFGLNAGAEYGPAKRWPEERFIEAAIEIQRRSKCRWLVFGAKSEVEASARIAAKINSAAKEPAAGHPLALNLAGQTALGELCAGLKLCRVLLTNDSGPMHVAAALGTTVVVPFGSTSPELTGPGLPGDARHQLLRADAPCSPCFLRECPIDFRCMKGISVAQVVEAVLRAAG